MLARGGRGQVLDRIERERGEFFHRVRDAYLARARAEPLDALELDAIESDADLAEFDFGAFDAAVEAPSAGARPEAPRYDAEDAALGGTLTLENRASGGLDAVIALPVV